MNKTSYKLPESVLVVIHTPGLKVLMLERARQPGLWQSVTGSKDHPDEPWAATARREVEEETGIRVGTEAVPESALNDWAQENVYEIYEVWRQRYAPGVLHNRERVFSLCVPEGILIQLAPSEHRQSMWLPWQEAAKRCFSPSNAEAILQLPHQRQRSPEVTG